MNKVFNEYLRQVVFFLLLLGLALLIFFQIRFLFSGFLGAVTLYILNRGVFLFLVKNKKWNKYIASLLLITFDFFLLFLPFLLASYFLVPKFFGFTDKINYLIEGIKEIIVRVNLTFGIEMLSKENLNNLPVLITSFITDFLGTAMNGFVNLLFAVILLFFMLINTVIFESVLIKYIPLKNSNKNQIIVETKNIVTSYAIGIPLIAIAQGLVAALGYWIFGINDALLFGLTTCICAIIPVVGSGLIWVPLVVYLYTHGHTEDALGLLFYCLIIVTNIDNFLRLFFLKAFADIHPLITLFGVITGLKLFGFVGLIFGPLLISYLLLLIRIYTNEFIISDE